MVTKQYKCMVVFLFIISLLSVCDASETEKSIHELRIVMDDNYPPYVMRDSKGNLIGMIPELWQLFEKETEMKIILIGADWIEAQKIIMEGQADVIDTIFKTPEREPLYDFSKPYADIPVGIFHHKSLSGITDARSLLGFTISVKKGDACVELLREKGVSMFRLYPSYESIIKDATSGNVKIFCMDEPPAFYYLEKYGISDSFRKGFLLYTGRLHRAVRKGGTNILSIVESGFASIPSEKIKIIRDKWMGQEIRPEPEFLKYVGPVSLVVLTLILFFGIWNFTLHRAVRKKTEELRKSLESIKERERLLRVTLANLEDGVIVTDSHGVISKLNRAAEELSGFREEEVLGKYFYEVLNVFDEKTGEKFLLKEHFEKALHQKGILRFEDNLLTLSSKSQNYSIEITLSPIQDEEENVSGAVIVLHDVTEEKKKARELEVTRKMFELAVEGARIGIGIFHVPQNIIYRNKIWNEMIGLEAEDTKESPENWFSLIHPDYRDRIKNSIIACLQGKIEFFNEEYPLKHCDGRWIWVHARGKVIERDERGNPIWYAGVIFDVTDKKLSDEKLRKLEKELSRISRLDSLGRLAGGIAHDFNNILMIILGYGEMALKELDDRHPAKIKVEQMVRSAERATQLTKQLLTFSKKQPARPELVEANQLLQNLEKMLTRIIGEDIELIMNLSAYPLYLLIDPIEMEQVIMNLTVNARDAMPRGGRLVLETALVELTQTYTEIHPGIRPGPYVLISITDTGHGMDIETIDHIFEPFFTTKAEGKGTGLGLSIVYGIVKRYDGEIHVYSEPEKGTTFKIYLPSANENPIENKEKEVKTGNAPSSRGEHILIVEDNTELRNLMKTYLAQLGYKITDAENGKEALSLISNEGKPDLIITDVIMPEMNGGTFIQELKKHFGDVEVIYMSGYPKDVVSRYDFFESEETLLMKPFKIDELIKIVRKKLGEKT